MGEVRPLRGPARRDDGLDAIYAPIREDLAAAESVLSEVLQAEAAPIGADLAALAASGKRVRAAVTISAARLGERDDPRLPTLAALAEILHFSSLIHDDVIDEAPLRRGAPTVHALRGVPLAVLAGDLLYSAVFLRMLREMPIEVVRTVIEGGRTMIEGEVRQNLSGGRLDLSDEQYEAVVGAKTGAFVAACARAGALLAKASPRAVEALSAFGYRFGLAFQVADDVLDWTAETSALGKEIAADLRGGKPTLPLLLFARRGDAAARIERARGGEIAPLLEAMRKAGVFEEALAVARTHAGAAVDSLAPLPDVPARRLLERLARFAVDRGR